MEEPRTPPPETPIPAAPNPAMDVVAPRPKGAPEAVASAPPEQTDPKAKQPAKQETPPKPKTPKPKGNGVTAAIFATVIIVLGLGLLAVYAYIKQNK